MRGIQHRDVPRAGDGLPDMTMEALIAWYRQREVKANLALGTRTQTDDYGAKSLRAIGRHVRDLNEDRVVEWLDEMRQAGVPPGQINRRIGQIRKITKAAAAFGGLWDYDPLARLSKLRAPPSDAPPPYEMHEARAILAACQSEPKIKLRKELYPLYLAYFEMGLRKMLPLLSRWEHINFEERTWFFPKARGNKNHVAITLPAGPILMSHLMARKVAAMPQPSDPVWPAGTKTSKNWPFRCKTYAYNHMRDHAVLAGVDFRGIHSARRFACTEMTLEGGDSNVTALVMGHRPANSLAERVYVKTRITQKARESVEQLERELTRGA